MATIVQYILDKFVWEEGINKGNRKKHSRHKRNVRGDLLLKEGWPVGAVIAQACHAATAVIHLLYTDESTQQYLKDLDNMHKVVLEVPTEGDLLKTAEKLKENDISHKLWIEQPENFATCLAVKPYQK